MEKKTKQIGEYKMGFSKYFDTHKDKIIITLKINKALQKLVRTFIVPNEYSDTLYFNGAKKRYLVKNTLASSVVINSSTN